MNRCYLPYRSEWLAGSIAGVAVLWVDVSGGCSCLGLGALGG